uniref:Translation initiation factor IF-2, chloroplastic n=1 Tax=Izziella formosana TaxID=1653389 RepID=A0A1G4NUJ6_9FLOR|nr:Translation initiation factor 2 [Izziella formosana]SCW22373.1 Translation initiation factor 2 [Izziella formosana]
MYLKMNFVKVNKEISPSWLNLNNPKLIAYETNQSAGSASSVEPLNEVLVDNINNMVANRIDKKSKNYNHSIDPLESKKNKVKTKKKTRSKIHINDDDENLENQYQGITKIGKNLEISLMRPPKPVRKKLPKKKIPTAQEHITSIPKKSSASNCNSDDIKHIPAIYLNNPLSVQELSILISIPAPEIIKHLFLQGISVTINQVIDLEMAQAIADYYNVDYTAQVNQKSSVTTEIQDSLADVDELNEDRIPIVTIFGHVDHGKTTLMDTICNVNSVDAEYGGITQAITAHEIVIDQDVQKKVIFLDTPGHEAFSDMRRRSIEITDIGILVVAADDGLRQQTIEAIEYFKEHNLSFLVAINKIDKDTANLMNIKQELTEHDVIAEDWGGDVPIVEISALQKLNIDRLLTALFRIRNQKQLKANSKISAIGTVLDSYLDTKQGPVAKLLVQNGTMRVGDYIVSNNVVSKVRAITNSMTQRIDSAGPSSIIDVYGIESILTSGNSFQVIQDEKSAKKRLAEYQKNKDKNSKNYKKLNTRLTLNKSENSGSIVNNKAVNIILKTESEGTIDAIINAFLKIPQNKVQINLVAAGVGPITVSDINLAVISNANIISFHEITPQIKHIANQSNISLANFQIIYDLLDYIKDLMISMVPVEYKAQKIGKAMVENTFSVSKGIVAGCIVTEGKLKLGAKIKVIREQETIYEGDITSLKRIKDDIQEVVLGNECGVMSANFSLWQQKDIIEAYTLIKQEKTL